MNVNVNIWPILKPRKYIVKWQLKPLVNYLSPLNWIEKFIYAGLNDNLRRQKRVPFLEKTLSLTLAHILLENGHFMMLITEVLDGMDTWTREALLLL